MKKRIEEVFNLRVAVVSVILYGIAVACVNVGHGWEEFFKAGTAQMIANFFATGIGAGGILICSRIEKANVSYFLATLIGGWAKFVFSFSAHVYNNTPELWLSSLTPTILAVVFIPLLHYGVRNVRKGWMGKAFSFFFPSR